MSAYAEMSREELEKVYEGLRGEFEAVKAQGLNLDMSRGKPSMEQLDLSSGLLDAVSSRDYIDEEEQVDVRNYGVLAGLHRARELFSPIFDLPADQVVIGGNSSLNLMYDMVEKAIVHGVYGASRPWGSYGKIKFLCPVPGYDRHFAITQHFGMEMIPIPMDQNGPDMDLVEQLVEGDHFVKGIWCVPKYSNPTGITYSDEVVRRIAALKPKADDFRIFWDNAYCIHEFEEEGDTLSSIMAYARKYGTEDLVYLFASTSKVTFPGSGIAAFGGSKSNVDYMLSLLGTQTIGYDKINQLRHIRFLRDYDGMREHMKKHAALIAPRFHLVLDTLRRELTGLAEWTEPKGGYFVAVDVPEGCAKRTVALCKEAGVVLTGAGATYPYGSDPADRNIRIAPTYPTLEELGQAIRLFCLCAKLAAAEKMLGK